MIRISPSAIHTLKTWFTQMLVFLMIRFTEMSHNILKHFLTFSECFSKSVFQTLETFQVLVKQQHLSWRWEQNTSLNIMLSTCDLTNWVRTINISPKDSPIHTNCPFSYLCMPGHVIGHQFFPQGIHQQQQEKDFH